MLFAILILFSSCVSANGCSPNVNAKPTTVIVNNCSSDNMCSSNEFCYVSTAKNLGGLTTFGVCVPCVDCNKFQRKRKGSCSKSLKECGPCLNGFEEIGDHCIQINQTTTTSTISYSTKNEIAFLNKSKNVTGDNYGGNNLWVIVSACIAGLVLLPACIGLLFLGRKHWKHTGNDPRDEANLIELGSGRRRSNNAIVPKPPDLPSAPEEYERPPPTYIESIAAEPRSNNGTISVVRAEVYPNAPLMPIVPPQIYSPSRNPSGFRSRHNMVDVSVENEILQMANPFNIGNAPGDWADESYADLDMELMNNNIVVNMMEVVENSNSDVHLVPNLSVGASAVNLNCDTDSVPVNDDNSPSNSDENSLSLDMDDSDFGNENLPAADDSFDLSNPPPLVEPSNVLSPAQVEAQAQHALGDIDYEAMELLFNIRFLVDLYNQDADFGTVEIEGNNSLLSNDSGTSSSIGQEFSFGENDEDSFYD